MILLVAPQIQAHHFAVLHVLNKTSDPVREAFLIYSSGTGALAFGENHDRFSASQKVSAFVERRFHLLTSAATVYGNALRKITQYGQKNIIFVVSPFGQIPGHFFIMNDMLAKIEHGIAQNKRIYHG